ncbi:threonine dehydratase [Dethiosulfatibacter aminovorans DSM 17477]|uniref:threonine ammonia-lyase n=1 Tax=Dethiosulfatibacter aminovorans DSM 17477 TaxID=1121476 RepID=A0A1M6ACS9_9FIRM|nr:threonine/serine dehydratase [Dethiosulfatibacter aminovorans]SHI34221.1 threonine dehydratase [Dethiosulfatibacter aminovorans DSM 17477]
MINSKMIVQANKRIKKYLKETPLRKSLKLSSGDTEVWLKLENEQPTVRSYKVRGVVNKLLSLSEEEIEKGVMAVSSGNHGAALAYMSSMLGIERCVIYAAETTPKPKVDKMRFFGAEVRLGGSNYDEAHKIAEREMKKEGLVEINTCEDPVLICGQGTIGLEMLFQEPELDCIVVPIGGGAMITGISVIAKALCPKIEIIGVQTESCPAMVKSIEDNICYEYFESAPSVCDALIGGVGRIGFDMAGECIDEILLVPESKIKEAVGKMLLEENIVAEPSSAICYGAYCMYSERFKGKKTGLVISGGNINEDLIKEIIGTKAI